MREKKSNSGTLSKICKVVERASRLGIDVWLAITGALKTPTRCPRLGNGIQHMYHATQKGSLKNMMSPTARQILGFTNPTLPISTYRLRSEGTNTRFGN
jgi:hypothetical protein